MVPFPLVINLITLQPNSFSPFLSTGSSLSPIGPGPKLTVYSNPFVAEEGDCLGVKSLANLVLGTTSLALSFKLSNGFAAIADLMLFSAFFKLPSKFLTEGLVLVLLELNLDLTGFGVAPVS